MFYLWFAKNNFEAVFHDQVGMCNESKNNYGYRKVNTEKIASVGDRGENISFLCTMRQSGLLFAWAHNKGTKR